MSFTIKPLENDECLMCYSFAAGVKWSLEFSKSHVRSMEPGTMDIDDRYRAGSSYAIKFLPHHVFIQTFCEAGDSELWLPLNGDTHATFMECLKVLGYKESD